MADNDGWEVVIPKKSIPKKYRNAAELKHVFDDENDPDRVYTYCLTAKSNFDMSHFHRLLKDSPVKWQHKTLDDLRLLKKVDFIFNDNQIPAIRKFFYSITTGLKNDIITDCVTNKAQLHQMMTEHAPYGIAETKVVNSETTINDGEIWIWRPASGYAGKGVHVIDTQAQLEELWKLDKTTFKTGYDKKWPEVIISKYIESPLLFKGRKTTFRAFLLATMIGEERHAYLFEKGFLRVSEKPYELGSFDDPAVHDCHLNRLATENKDLFYPKDVKDLADTDKTSAQLRRILKDVFTNALPKFEAYTEAKHSYRVFGVDFMIDTDNRVYLIEVNGRPGMNLIESSDSENMYGMLSEGIFRKAVMPSIGHIDNTEVPFMTQLV